MRDTRQQPTLKGYGFNLRARTYLSNEQTPDKASMGLRIWNRVLGAVVIQTCMGYTMPCEILVFQSYYTDKTPCQLFELSNPQVQGSVGDPLASPDWGQLSTLV